jgi:hypothetical protein
MARMTLTQQLSQAQQIMADLRRELSSGVSLPTGQSSATAGSWKASG